MLRIRIADAEAVLHPSGAVLLPAQRTVLVADAYFGKAVSFRRLAVPVPRGTTTATLDELSAVLADTQDRRIIFLGDFLIHAALIRPAHWPRCLDGARGIQKSS